MQKDFDAWNKKKKELESREQRISGVHERQIWWCSLGLNIGDEEDGKNDLFERPILIIRKYNKRFVLVIPLTSNIKFDPHYHRIENRTMGSAILSQARPISTKRFDRLARTLAKSEFEVIIRKYTDLVSPIQ